MARRFASFILLGILGTAQAAPLAASGLVCSMQRSSAPLCARCDVAVAPNRATSVSAGSCCRFGTASATSPTPGVVPSLQRAQESPAAPVSTLAAGPSGAPTLAPAFPSSHPPSLRSSDSPVTRNNTLRL